ncbi:MAG: peptidylprolyl isomerase [Bacteriovoracaceae bacterium]|nr:peptidylprolyl isomerase [Bacteriovoracaceae bacterium]
MKIAKDIFVEINYTLTDGEGQLLDYTDANKPFQYVHGHKQMLKGLEAQMGGKQTGDKFIVSLLPNDAYGEYDAGLVSTVAPEDFEDAQSLKVGMMFHIPQVGGPPQSFRIIKIESHTITVDANHPLAGKTLNFDVEIMSMRQATKEDLIPKKHVCRKGKCTCPKKGDCGDDGCKDH